MNWTRTKKEAEREARGLLRRMKTKGWSIVVYKNVGWFFGLRNGPLTLYPSTVDGEYFCLLSSEANDPIGGGEMYWTPTKSRHRDPNRAVREQMKLAEEFVGRVSRTVGDLREALRRRAKRRLL